MKSALLNKLVDNVKLLNIIKSYSVSAANDV